MEKGKNDKEQPPCADPGHSVPERESTKGLEWEHAWSIQTIERIPKWLERGEQGGVKEDDLRKPRVHYSHAFHHKGK